MKLHRYAHGRDKDEAAEAFKKMENDFKVSLKYSPMNISHVDFSHPCDLVNKSIRLT